MTLEEIEKEFYIHEGRYYRRNGSIIKKRSTAGTYALKLSGTNKTFKAIREAFGIYIGERIIGTKVIAIDGDESNVCPTNMRLENHLQTTHNSSQIVMPIDQNDRETLAIAYQKAINGDVNPFKFNGVNLKMSINDSGKLTVKGQNGATFERKIRGKPLLKGNLIAILVGTYYASLLEKVIIEQKR
ncbi:hypothetical protein [Neptunicoccus sediminis]|uniref:hypothetical protein n=1 Tax=Neptunicoccus sediminis TaxID=1892596 RepID=UPI000845DBA3|nr:hypothetical protein [Neptunicoccus sediminis]